MTQKGSNWQQVHNIREMNKTYTAAEWLLRAKIDELGYLVHRLRLESVVLSVNAAYSKQFLDEKVLMLLEESVQKHSRQARAKQRAHTAVLGE